MTFKRALVVAIVLVACAGGIGVSQSLVTGRDNFDAPGSEAVRTRAALADAANANPDADVHVLVTSSAGRRETLGRARAATAALRADRAVALTRLAGVASDGGTALVIASFRPASAEADVDTAERLRDRLEPLPGTTVGGPVAGSLELRDRSAADLRRAEVIALPVLLLCLLVVFRGALAATLPLLVGVVSVLLTFAALRLLAGALDISIFAINVVTAVGLGLAIDYSLFMVSRFREELARHPPHEALRRTRATAGRTVLVSSLTVAASLASLLLFEERFLYSMGLGGSLVALAAGASSLLLLPPVLRALAPRLGARAPRSRTGRGPWGRTAAAVVRRPGLVTVVAGGLLLLAASPLLHAYFSGLDARDLPRSADAHQVASTLERELPQIAQPPIIAVARAPRGDALEVAAWRDQLAGLPGTVGVSRPRAAGSAFWRVDVLPSDETRAVGTQRLVEQVRETPAPFPTAATGEAARVHDLQADLGRRLPLVLVVLGLASYALLTAATRSVVLPLVVLISNALTIAATLGAIVFVFQDGHFESLLDYTSSGALQSPNAVLLVVLAFALSTDYAIFVLSRVKEEFDRGLATADAVVEGLDRTGGLITAAALLFCIAVGALVTGEVVFLKQLGLGAAVAVLLDATIVRALLFPAVMTLLGDRIWWAPRATCSSSGPVTR